MSNYPKKSIFSVLGASIVLQFLATPAFALDIIPGLKGFGTDTRAAYGAVNTPEICIVDDLTANAGNPNWVASGYSVGVFKGSLNQCVEGLDTLSGETIDGHVVAANSGKIVLFEVSGTIEQNGSNGDVNTFRYFLKNYTTIAGQTAPKPGILFRNISIVIAGYHDVLIQHVRGRLDGPPSLSNTFHKPFMVETGARRGSASNIIFDHVSAAWGSDAQIECWHANSTGALQNITMANCILGEPREGMYLIGDEDGTASAQDSMFGTHFSGPMTNFLAYGNLITNGRRRNPKIQNAHGLWVNNYSYNNKDLGYQCVGPLDAATCAAVSNVLAGGPMSGTFASKKMPNLGTDSGGWDKPLSQHKIYLIDNKTDAGTQTSSNDWSLVDDRTGLDLANNMKVRGENPPTDSPLWPTGLTYLPSSGVKDYIVANAGAYPAFRDSLDTRFIKDMISGTGPSSIATGPPSAGDWPVLAEHTITLAIPSNPHGDDDSDGYTNLEEWLHSKAAIVEGKIKTSTLSSSPAERLSPPFGLYTR